MCAQIEALVSSFIQLNVGWMGSLVGLPTCYLGMTLR